MQHFRIVNNTFPQPESEREVYEDLKLVKSAGYIIRGLRLVFPTYNPVERKDDNPDETPSHPPWMEWRK